MILQRAAKLDARSNGAAPSEIKVTVAVGVRVDAHSVCERAEPLVRRARFQPD